MSFMLCAFLFGSEDFSAELKACRATYNTLQNEMSRNNRKFMEALEKKYPEAFGNMVVTDSNTIEREKNLFVSALDDIFHMNETPPTHLAFAFAFFERNAPTVLDDLESRFSSRLPTLDVMRNHARKIVQNSAMTSGQQSATQK